MFTTPLLFIIFNRLETTKQVFSRIREIQPTQLFISADGPRPAKQGEKEKCDAVRKFVLDSIDWPCKVEVLFRDQNLGCKYAVSGGIKWFFEQVEMGIVLEDDCLPSPSFFGYCQTLLEYYKDDTSVGMISGHNYFGKTDGNHDYSFITTCGVWGWAGWRRVMKGYDPDYSTLIDHDIKDVKTICFRKEAANALLNNACAAATNKINTWDYQFCEYLIVNKMFTIMPGVNLIKNIGFIAESTHSATPPHWYKDELYSMESEIRFAKKVRLNKGLSKKIESFHLNNQGNMIDKLLGKISGRLRRYAGQFNECYVSSIRYIDGTFGEKKRYSFYKKHLRFVGENVRFDTGVYIYGMEYVSIGANTHIDKNCIIVGSHENLDLSNRIVKTKLNDSELVKKGEVIIGAECHISQNCMIYGYGGVYVGDNCVMSTGSKVYSLTSMPTNPQDETQIISIVPYNGISPTLIGKVTVHNNVWIGIDSVISPGVDIGENSFVRSNSFVLMSFGENSYIAGDPAVYKHERFKIK